MDPALDPAHLDPTDPIVSLLAIGAGELLKALLPERAFKSVKPWLPVIIVLVAAALAAARDAMLAEGGVSWQTVTSGLVAGMGAVTSHSAFRSWLKGRSPEALEAPDQAQPRN